MTAAKHPGDTIEKRAKRLHNSRYGNLPELTAEWTIPYTDDNGERFVLLLSSAGRLLQVYRVRREHLQVLAQHNWPEDAVALARYLHEEEKAS